MPLFSQILPTLRLTLKPLLCLLCLSLLPITLMAQTNHTSALNDLNYDLETQQFSVVGEDPFFTFKPEVNVNNASAAQYLILDLKFRQAATSAVLFFNAKNDGFDPQYLIEFKVPSDKFALKLPEEIDLIDTVLRLDIEKCPNCQFSFGGAQLSNTTNTVDVVEPTFFKNGRLRVSNEKGYDILTNSWSLNDLEGNINEFTISGEDPFILSPLLDISTKDLGGLYLKFERPQSKQHYDFQLFYATENHKFTEEYSSIIRLNPDYKSHDQIQVTEFMIPLEYLDLEAPQDHILKRVRLDLPLIDGSWSLISSKLVHREQLGAYSLVVPTRMVQMKRQRISGRMLLRKIVSNVWADRTFIISFILLLLIVSGLFYRAFRK